jgi:hypothetical protein
MNLITLPPKVVCGRPTLLTYPLTPEARAFTLYVDSFVKDKARSAGIADVVSKSEDPSIRKAKARAA